MEVFWLKIRDTINCLIVSYAMEAATADCFVFPLATVEVVDLEE